MSLLSLLLLALGLSVDAFAAAIGRGVVAPERPSIALAMRTGIIFGLVEMSAPVVGWLLGAAFSGHVEAIDHWIAFVLLVGVGGHTVWGAYEDDDAETTAETETRGAPWLLVITAVGTSIDSMVVGVSLALLEVDIRLAAPIIGVTTFTMATIGMYAGKAIGDRFGRRAEIAAGVGLALLGCGILWGHTMG